MWSAALLRFIRRRIVLAVIFCMSLTYCLVNFMQKSASHIETEELEIRRTRPIIWRTADDLLPYEQLLIRPHLNDSSQQQQQQQQPQQQQQQQPPLGIANHHNGQRIAADATAGSSSSSSSSNDPNATQTTAPQRNCRNSVQGRVWLVDDRGLVCLRADLHTATGCCAATAASTALHSCATCDATEHCCSGYEHCVSCCLHPDKRALLERVIARATGRMRTVYETVADHFELCLAKCRTDSHSVQHENQYRRPAAKHCYGLTEAHESQLDVGGQKEKEKAAGESAAKPLRPNDGTGAKAAAAET